MTEAHGRLDSATLARLTEAWLALGVMLDLSSLALSVLAMVTLLLGHTALLMQIGLICTVALGVLEKYFALRVAFDRRLFLHWAERWENFSDAKPEEDMARLDAALAVSGIRKQPILIPRELIDRQRGAFRLFRYQFITLLAQGVAILATALIAHSG
jgi:hypothetical protein